LYCTQIGLFFTSVAVNRSAPTPNPRQHIGLKQYTQIRKKLQYEVQLEQSRFWM